ASGTVAPPSGLATTAPAAGSQANPSRAPQRRGREKE
ncbi:hypothetical protein A2U01_0080883, partial [Trifolium medium]|nr:hypothetical protein [Trifolium medium]